MRKLRAAAVVAAAVGSVSLIGAGAATAHEEPAPSVSITCEQDTGDNTLTSGEAAGTVAGVNVADALNGGDADSSANQQLCGLENEDVDNAAGGSTGGAGGAVASILAGA